jgi:hypothetical protein
VLRIFLQQLNLLDRVELFYCFVMCSGGLRQNATEPAVVGDLALHTRQRQTQVEPRLGRLGPRSTQSCLSAEKGLGN